MKIYQLIENFDQNPELDSNFIIVKEEQPVGIVIASTRVGPIEVGLEYTTLFELELIQDTEHIKK